MAARPAAGRRAVEVLLEAELPRAEGRRLVLVDAVWAGGDQEREFTVQVDGTARRVHVTDQDSPLGIADAWRHHTTAVDPDGDSVLVVTGQVPADQLGWDLRGHAVRRRPLAVERADIVKQLFGAGDLDTRMVRETWLLDALLEAEPSGGWPRAGSVLTRDRALRVLLAARVGLGDTRDESLDLDADTLFDWSRTPAGPRCFAELPEQERTGLTTWLEEVTGPAAPTLLALAADGRGADALPLGALASAALACPAAADAGFALGTLFGHALGSFDALAPYASAATGVLTRWIAQAEAGGSAGTDARTRVLAVLERADRLADTARLTGLLAGDRLLPSGYRARLRTLAAALDGRPGPAQTALRDLTDHQLAALHTDSTERARTAVRLLRWLDGPQNTQGAQNTRDARAVQAARESVGRSVRHHLESTGWVDLATGILAEGDASRDSEIGEAYHRLIGRVRDRRRQLDETFAATLAIWTEAASQQAPHGALLIEDVLAQAAAPLARDGGRPLVLVLDGMSADVAVELAAGLAPRTWTEIVPTAPAGRRPGRLAAVAMLPTLTRISRASLLSGAPAEGGQDTERTGFTAFWKKRHRESVLFHKGGYEGTAGHRLAPALLEALADEKRVVGVIVNTVDDALADGRENGRARWRTADIAKLADLLDAALGAGRPVLLVSDHGHILDRSPRESGPTVAEGVRGARWRTGPAGPGEVELTGPRVRTAGGRITAAWRDDLRYTARQAGYHGGASLAEVTVPVLAFVPSGSEIPAGWTALPTEDTAPEWWRGDAEAAPPQEPAPAPRGGKGSGGGNRKRQPQHESLFPQPGQGTPGERTVRSKPFETQREFVRNAPGNTAVAAVLDALLAAGGKLSPAAVAAAAQAATGKSERNPQRFVTMLERLLNIDGYPVLQLVESGRTVHLDRELLRQQFPEGTAP
ncbi:BREX-2 system phosphatase PglZ [Streptomyces sp. MAR25Y5]|uniref:BREX-2 system phosphatase PglZ n=1 Tax=Streptomyces sp. MAR25Y5 TaxID=2962028 RepID=UPI0020B6E120|nr:BREX-2 system phosphatase PglZ [Streptomyces sp. MAR25Y5]MCP3766516.1 BREX-2 system phosphatase PglZ [Streptomyces sp. MAR25Y5]